MNAETPSLPPAKPSRPSRRRHLRPLLVLILLSVALACAVVCGELSGRLIDRPTRDDLRHGSMDRVRRDLRRWQWAGCGACVGVAGVIFWPRRDRP